MTEREALKLAQKALSNRNAPPKTIYEALHAIKEALAQPEQKPVACVQDLDEVKRKHLVYEKGMDWKDPLYTTPPQRTWVGLTPEEVEACIHHVDEAGIGLFDFAEAIEAKLKEKNT